MRDDAALPTADLREFYPTSRACTLRHAGRVPATRRVHDGWAMKWAHLVGDPGGDKPLRACGCSHVLITAPTGVTVRLIGPIVCDSPSLSVRELYDPTIVRPVTGMADSDRWRPLFAPVSNVTPAMWIPDAVTEDRPVQWSRLMALHALISGATDTYRGWTAEPSSLVNLIDWHFHGVAGDAEEAQAWAGRGLTAATVMHWQSTGEHDTGLIREWGPHFAPSVAVMMRKHFPDAATAAAFDPLAEHLKIATLAALHRDGVPAARVKAALDALTDPVQHVFANRFNGPHGWTLPPDARTPLGAAALIRLARHVPDVMTARLALAGVTPEEAASTDRASLDLIASLT